MHASYATLIDALALLQSARGSRRAFGAITPPIFASFGTRARGRPLCEARPAACPAVTRDLRSGRDAGNRHFGGPVLRPAPPSPERADPRTARDRAVARAPRGPAEARVAFGTSARADIAPSLPRGLARRDPHTARAGSPDAGGK